MTRTSPATALVLVLLLAWLLVALAAGASGTVERLRPPAPQIIIFGLAIATYAAFRYVPAINAWATTVDPRWFVAFHLTRFVGFYFLFLYGRGELPYEFAVPGGWGDIAVAVFALGLLVTGPAVGGRRILYTVWNVVGLVDILLVVGSAVRLVLADPEALIALQRLPLSLLPTFVVPIIIATHIWLFTRLRPSNSDVST